ncbi:MAG: hypothetical protein B5M53_05905 [Candidatus Cloacimonas sp. 4484_209]|nr:MAG: hypothetical protein B5M53_05905 [Candidatus Cloacimonas sp. 4484_209]
MTTKNRLKEILSRKILLLDGAMGTELIKRGYGEFPPEIYLLKMKKPILDIQKDYVNAGCDILLTATFGANRLKLQKIKAAEKTEEINRIALDIAKKAAGDNVLVAGGMGPTGEMFHPAGKLEFNTAYECFFEQARILNKGGVDLFILETFTDIRELKSAVLAVRDNAPDIFIVANLTFEASGRTLSGTDPVGFALSFKDIDVDALGINCSLGPEGILPIFQELSVVSEKFLCVEPNAGIPEIIDGKPFYNLEPARFVKYSEDFFGFGANIIGGCCGTGPEHIALLADRLKGKKPQKRKIEHIVGISSIDRNVLFSNIFSPVVIGERINPTGKKKMTESIEKGDTEIILKEAKKQSKAGASVLDLNLGLESGLSKKYIKKIVAELLGLPGLPIAFDMRSEPLIEAALQEYGGRPLLNSITPEDMEKKVSLLKRYGGMAVFLPIGDDGIPKSAEERIKVTLRALAFLKEMGFGADRLLLDPIVMSLATGYDPRITIDTLRLYKSKGFLTVLGLSNISYGLPERVVINAHFLSLCVNNGLDAVIMNPLEKETIFALNLSSVFTGRKELKEFLSDVTLNSKARIALKEEDKLFAAILDGEKNKVLTYVKEFIKRMDYTKVIEDLLRPILEKIGELYEKKRIFLPQLILAAESAQVAFGYIERTFKKEKKRREGKVVIATVRGDIHDIGKNIVAMMLKNAGFEVIDLGKDVPTEDIVDEAVKQEADIIGLSALMTTTAIRMQEVIGFVKKKKIKAQVMVGGACVTEKFAKEIGADAYAKDASGAVRIAKELVKK